MELKANLHFHTSDDPQDFIPYSFKQGIDYASRLGFEVLAITCHNLSAWNPDYAKYAAEKNILLIPGIEIDLGEKAKQKRHVVILNCDKKAEKLQTLKDLENYKKARPEILVIAPHPYFPGNTTLKKYLEKYIHLFDAIEHCWFYSKNFNLNQKAQKIAQKHKLPFIASSDTHFLDFLNTDYAVIDAPEKSAKAVLQAIRKNNFSNISRPKKFIREMCFPFTKFRLRNKFLNARKFIQ